MIQPITIKPFCSMTHTKVMLITSTSYKWSPNPSQPVFESIMARNFIYNRPITIADVKCANKVFSPSVPKLKGWTTQKTSTQIANTVPTAIPKSVLEGYQNGVLCIDFFMWTACQCYMLWAGRSTIDGYIFHCPTLSKRSPKESTC